MYMRIYTLYLPVFMMITRLVHFCIANTRNFSNINYIFLNNRKYLCIVFQLYDDIYIYSIQSSNYIKLPYTIYLFFNLKNYIYICIKVLKIIS